MPGLPNITGWFKPFGGNQTNAGYGVNGAFYTVTVANGNNVSNSDSRANVAYTIGINAAKSSSIYGNSNTVQPPTMCLIPQIKY